MTTAKILSERITAYLAGGGLFNPELADHDAVRDLLIDCRACLHTIQYMNETQRSELEKLIAHHELQAKYFEPFGAVNALTLFHAAAAKTIRTAVAND